MSLFTKNPAEFYPYAVHFLFTLLLTSTFGIAQNVFIPIGEVDTFAEQINAFALFFIYFVLISGWIGYTRSVSKRPHTDTSWGTLRFTIDVLIIITTFYLTALTDPKTFEKNFSEVFIGVLPALFLLYLFWDCVRYKEYSQLPVGTAENCYKDNTERKKELDILKRRLWTTFAFLLFLISQTFFFVYFISVLNLSASKNILETYQIFIIVSMSIIAVYRFKKWNFPSLRVYHV